MVMAGLMETVSSGSRNTTSGMELLTGTGIFMSCSVSVRTEPVESSAPVPLVVGATKRPGDWTCGLAAYSRILPSLKRRRFIALAMSMALPPPIATTQSQPFSRAKAAPSSTREAGGSLLTRSKSTHSMP